MRQIAIIMIIVFIMSSTTVFANTNELISIEKENTSTEEEKAEVSEVISPQLKKLLTNTKTSIENQQLLTILNEIKLKKSLFNFNYNVEVYFGRWPISYQTVSTEVIEQYELINTMELNNYYGQEDERISYIQKENIEVTGVLLNKVDQVDMVKKMLLKNLQARKDSSISFTTKIGQNTKVSKAFSVPKEKYGILSTFQPAYLEKGLVTYADVYLVVSRNEEKIIVKNVHEENVGALLPIKNYVTFTFELS